MKIKTMVIGVLVLSLFLAGCSNSTAEETPLESLAEELPEKVEVEQVTEEIETVSATHTVKFINRTFEPKELTIKVGDTVVWQNDRDAPGLNKAMVLGTQKCSSVKSKILETGETFEWTFTESGTCKIVDGYLTSNFGTVIVEE